MNHFACILLDAHISPSLALWINQEFAYECYSLSYIGLAKASDAEIYQEAKNRNAVIITKDIDFLELQKRLGLPPKVIWLTCGNTSKQALKDIFRKELQNALHELKNKDIVEISG